MDLAVAGERVAADLALLVAVVAVGAVDQAGGVGVDADGIEVALEALPVERLDEVEVVAHGRAGDDDVVRLRRLDGGVRRLDHRGVLHGVGAAGPEDRLVLLVPQLPGVDAGDLRGERAHGVAERGGIGRRMRRALAARGPVRRPLDHEEDLQALGLGVVDRPVHVRDHVGRPGAGGRLRRLPRSPEPDPAGAELGSGLRGRPRLVERLVHAGLDGGRGGGCENERGEQGEEESGEV
jgi:hypothetical protein